MSLVVATSTLVERDHFRANGPYLGKVPVQNANIWRRVYEYSNL